MMKWESVAKRDAEHDNKQKIDDDVNESEIGGSQVDDLIDEVEAEEQGVRHLKTKKKKSK